MITIDLGTIEYYNDAQNQFEYEQGGIVRFEYTLKILYDWEAKWRKPFLKLELTDEEWTDFCHMMALDSCDRKFLTSDVKKLLLDYIQDQPTATTFSAPPEGQNGNNGPKKAKMQTAEELYALMFEAGVPIEFENRNLNRLLIVLKIIGSHNNPAPKMNKQDILKQNKSLNAERKAKMKTRG